MEDWRKQARDLQQAFYEKLGDRRWDYIRADQHWALESKVGFAIFGPPNDASEINNNGYSVEQRKEIRRLCDIIYRTANDGDILIAFLFVIGKSEDGLFILPFFRVQNNRDDKAYFIDNLGREYKDWSDYIENNKLPESEVCYPSDGIYDSDSTGNVLVIFTKSPASTIGSQVWKVADIGSGIISGALVVGGVVSLFVPVVGPFGTAMAWGSAGCGVYGVTRGSQVIHDRRTHAQSVSLLDREARNCWLSVAGSVLGVGSGLAMKGMVYAVAQGQVVGSFGRAVVNTLNFGSLTVNGVGIVNNLVNLVEKYQENQLTTLDVLQFTSSVLFFSNAAMNSKTASSIIEQVQKDTLSNFSSDMSKRRTKAFNKLVRKSGGDGTMEDRARIIKGITQVGSKDEFFRMTIRAQKQSSSTVLNSEGKLEVNQSPYVDTDIRLQTHVRNDPGASAATPNNLADNVDRELTRNELTPSAVAGIIFELGKEFISVNDVKIYIKDLWEKFIKLFKKYFHSKAETSSPKVIAHMILNAEMFAGDAGCRTREDFIDFARFLCIYVKARLRDLERRYQREKDAERELMGEEFDERRFDERWGIIDAGEREGSFLKIINDEICKSNRDLKEMFEKYNREVGAINQDGNLKFRSDYHALNEFYHCFVIDGEEMSPSEFFLLIRGIVSDENSGVITEDCENGRYMIYSDPKGHVLVTVEECRGGRFLKSVIF